MDIEQFESLVARAVQSLPDEFQDRLRNVDVVVDDVPTASQLLKAGLKNHESLLGLYEGVPQTRRGVNYGLVLPDKITLFRQAIEARCRNDDEIRVVIQNVVRHEIAHHFGISDERLEQIERGEFD
jgi:predicted Zn-dependent protease with MMP-like domain